MVSRKRSLAAAILLASSQLAVAGDLNINGFMNVTAGYLDNKDVGVTGYEDGINFDQGTLVGLQLSQQVNDTTSATVQLISRGSERYQTEAAWAYITYAAGENTDLRAGRLRTPFFHYSDFLEVGYAFNWVNPPSVVYRLNDMSSMTGVDMTHRFSAGSLDGSVQIYAGRYNDDFTLSGDSYEMELRRAGGAVISLNYDNFGSRISYHKADFYINGLDPTGDRALDQLIALATGYDMANGTDITSEFVPDGETSNFYQASLSWDNGDTALLAEYTALRHDSALLNDDDAWMVGASQRITAATALHLTYAHSEDQLKSGDTGIAQSFTESENDSIILGLRYDYDSAATIKFEVQHLTDKSSDKRLAAIAANPADIDGARNLSLTEESGVLYNVGLSLVF